MWLQVKLNWSLVSQGQTEGPLHTNGRRRCIVNFWIDFEKDCYKFKSSWPLLSLPQYHFVSFDSSVRNMTKLPLHKTLQELIIYTTGVVETFSISNKLYKHKKQHTYYFKYIVLTHVRDLYTLQLIEEIEKF